MVAEVAFVEDHDSVDDSPGRMDLGLAEMFTVGGSGTWLTETVTLSVSVPPGPVTVMV